MKWRQFKQTTIIIGTEPNSEEFSVVMRLVFHHRMHVHTADVRSAKGWCAVIRCLVIFLNRSKSLPSGRSVGNTFCIFAQTQRRGIATISREKHRYSENEKPELLILITVALTPFIPALLTRNKNEMKLIGFYRTNKRTCNHSYFFFF